MNAQYLYLDAHFVKAQIAKLMEAYPDLAEDESLRMDMIEGETNAVQIIERAFSERQEAETMAGAIKAREVEMAARRGRFESKSEAMRSLIKSVMNAAALDNLQLTEATFSITKPRASVEIIDLEAVPQGYAKFVKQADKAAIKSALDQGEEVPGAELRMSGPGLTIRTK